MKKLRIFPLLPDLYTASEIMILDFNQISEDLPDYKNIKLYFDDCRKSGLDPKLPENRQKFNNNFLKKAKKRYLISRYTEDRIEMLKGSQIAQEGRTIHLGIDIFSEKLEKVYSPFDGEIVFSGKEPGGHSFGNYLILKPDPQFTNNYIFLAHLSGNLPTLKSVKKGEAIATIGDYIENENGGWSRHLHVQLLEKLPENGKIPIGYSSKKDLKINMRKYPDPSFLVFS